MFGKIIFTAVVAAVLGSIGIFCNARWKNSDPEIRALAPWGIMTLIGLFGWIALLLFLFGGLGGACFLFILLTAALLALTGNKALKAGMDRGELPKLLGIVLLSGLGKWMGTLLRYTIIGIPAVRYLEGAGKYGLEAMGEELLRIAEEEAKKPRQEEPQQSVWDTYDTYARQEPEPEPEKKVEVWRPNGLVNEYLKVNSDNTMYYDPDDGEWHRIPD